MRRIIVLIAIFLTSFLGAVTVQAAPGLGGPKSQARIEAERARAEEIQRQDELMEKAIEEDNARHEEVQRQNADQIRASEDNIDQWMRDNPAPRGTLVRRAISYDWETALVEHGAVTWTDRHGMTTHRIEFGPGGMPTGPLELTQQGKVAEKLKNEWPEDGSTASYSYSETPEGEQIISHVIVGDADGHPLVRFWFNQEGVAWKGERWDPETGRRTGSFQDDRLKDPPETMGGPLRVPELYRLITQPCEPCRAATEAYNDLANAWNTRVSELRELSDRHQKSYPRAQIPIRMRHEHLMGELAAMRARVEAARTAALACDCGEPDEPKDTNIIASTGAPVEVTLPPLMCTQGSGPVCDYAYSSTCIEGGDLGCDYEPICSQPDATSCQYTYPTDLDVGLCIEETPCELALDDGTYFVVVDGFSGGGNDGYTLNVATCAEGARCEKPIDASCTAGNSCEPQPYSGCTAGSSCEPIPDDTCTGGSCDQFSASTCSASGTVGTGGEVILPPDKAMQKVFDMHNAARVAVGSVPLLWDPILAQGAQAHADREAKTGAFEHTPLSERNEGNFGDNISLGARSKITAAQMLQVWLDEAEFFTPGAFPNLCEGDWSQCGHYSAVVWSATIHLGCGYAVEVYVVLICRYSPPGNQFGQQALGVPQILAPPAPNMAVSDPCPVPSGGPQQGSHVVVEDPQPGAGENPLAEPGTYFVRVDGFGADNSAGEYNLNVSPCTGSACDEPAAPLCTGSACDEPAAPLCTGSACDAPVDDLCTGSACDEPPATDTFDIRDFFSELWIPIVDGAGFDDLRTVGGLRVSDYTGGCEWTYSSGIDSAPVDGIGSRGTYQRSVRAPNVAELFAPLGSGIFGRDPVFDPPTSGGPATNQLWGDYFHVDPGPGGSSGSACQAGRSKYRPVFTYWDERGKAGEPGSCDINGLNCPKTKDAGDLFMDAFNGLGGPFPSIPPVSSESHMRRPELDEPNYSDSFEDIDMNVEADITDD